MIRTALYLEPITGCHDEAVRYFRDNLVIEMAVPYGLVRGELALPLKGNGPLLSAALWPDRQAYADWTNAPERSRIVAGMDDWLAGPNAVRAVITEIPYRVNSITPDFVGLLDELTGTSRGYRRVRVVQPRQGLL